jgi:hypothetical protein
LLSKLRTRLTYANVMATIAVFVALGGSSYAALKITGRNVRDSSLTTRDVKNRSLLGVDFKRGQLPAGQQGAQGPQGPQGPQGTPGPPGAAASATSRDFKPGLIATASDTFEPFDGPSVTVQVPEGGAPVVLGASVEARNTAGGEAWAFVFEDGNGLNMRISEAGNSTTFVTKKGGGVTWASAGTHTYDLRYRRQGSGTAEYRNRALAAAVLK